MHFTYKRLPAHCNPLEKADFYRMKLIRQWQFFKLQLCISAIFGGQLMAISRTYSVLVFCSSSLALVATTKNCQTRVFCREQTCRASAFLGRMQSQYSLSPKSNVYFCLVASRTLEMYDTRGTCVSGFVQLARDAFPVEATKLVLMRSPTRQDLELLLWSCCQLHNCFCEENGHNLEG